jgi:hypothetical protein
VNATLLWPAHSETSRTLQPAATRIATQLCRRPWKVMLGIPARMTAWHANHLYLQAVGDGDPHNLIRPETIAPSTPTESLQQILARDDAPSSASTQLRELNDSASRLFDAVRRYTDSLQAAAEQTVGRQELAELDLIDEYIPGLTNEPTWPTLRAHLINLAAESGEHPLVHLQEATLGRDLSTTGDMAAVLYWRLTAFTTPDPGPLPWLPDVPARLRDDMAWGAHLTKRARLVADLASQVRDQVDREAAPPTWAAQGSHPSATLVGDITIWRAANGIDSLDPQPTGGDQLDTALNWWKQSLDRYIALATKAPHKSEVDQQRGRRRPRRHTYADLQRSYQTPRSNPPSVPGR